MAKAIKLADVFHMLAVLLNNDCTVVAGLINVHACLGLCTPLYVGSQALAV